MSGQRWPKEGERIEFLSDQLTDKGPATGEIVGIKTTVDGNYLTVKFADGQQMFSWEDLDAAGADVRGDLWMVKSYIKGHVRGSVYVRPHQRGPAAANEPEAQHHPKPGENGEPVLVKRPHHASAPSTWHNPDAVATFVPGGDVPLEINGVPLRRWKDHPTTSAGWEYAEGISDDLVEPPFRTKPGKTAAAGVVIFEPDGRVWAIHPTNGFGGMDCTWPKGGAEDGMSLQSSALKEAWEESGLKVRITGFIGDYERSTSVARMYRAVRVGGCPTDSTWEAQGVSLIPKSLLHDMMTNSVDRDIATAAGAGPKPKK